MSFVTAIPGSLATAAESLTAMGAASAAGHGAALPGITAVIPPAEADPTSVLGAAAFEAHGAMYSAVAAWYLANHGLFAANMGGNELAYGAVEAANGLAMG
jgi:hypothetical protein